MNTPKYYTPTFEEFHYGFEYQFQPKTTSGNGIGYMKAAWESDRSLLNLFSEFDVRVKCLDHEDIESFGFEENGNIIIEDTTDIAKLFTLTIDDTENKEKYYDLYEYQGKYHLIFNNYRNSVGCEEHTLFVGQIKNKSELKKVLQMVGVLPSTSAPSQE